jgi:phosphoenolpyruvate synthase/pyruvate phosphate dikinase
MTLQSSPLAKTCCEGWACDLRDGAPDWDIGGKARGILSMMSANLATPEGIVLHPALARQAARPGDTCGVEARRFDKVLDGVWALFADRAAGGLAIRSSASIEDGIAFSHAGAFDSVLGVTNRAAFGTAVRRVAISAGRPWPGSDEVNMPILVQPMIAAQVSAVMFDCDPVTGDHSVRVIECTEGGCERIVAGEAVGRVLVNKITNTFAADCETPLVSFLSGRLDELARCASLAATATGRPTDLELCWTEAGTLVVLQCRPVTALPDARSRNDLGEPGAAMRRALMKIARQLSD